MRIVIEQADGYVLEFKESKEKTSVRVSRRMFEDLDYVDSLFHAAQDILASLHDGESQDAVDQLYEDLVALFKTCI